MLIRKSHSFFIVFMYSPQNTNRAFVMVNWRSSLGSKSFHEDYFVFDNVLKPLFSKPTLSWPGGWNKEKVNFKNNIESKLGQLRAGCYSQGKPIC